MENIANALTNENFKCAADSTTIYSIHKFHGMTLSTHVSKRFEEIILYSDVVVKFWILKMHTLHVTKSTWPLFAISWIVN